MKRALFLVPLALGGALWLVNWRLDHPPPTIADKEFQTQMQGVDKVEIDDVGGARLIKLKGKELEEFIHLVQLTGRRSTLFSNFSYRWKVSCFSNGKSVDGFLLTPDATVLIAYGARRKNGQPWAVRLGGRAARRVRTYLLEASYESTR
jgi:hypothetical protein